MDNTSTATIPILRCFCVTEVYKVLENQKQLNKSVCPDIQICNKYKIDSFLYIHLEKINHILYGGFIILTQDAIFTFSFQFQRLSS